MQNIVSLFFLPEFAYTLQDRVIQMVTDAFVTDILFFCQCVLPVPRIFQ